MIIVLLTKSIINQYILRSFIFSNELATATLLDFRLSRLSSIYLVILSIIFTDSINIVCYGLANRFVHKFVSDQAIYQCFQRFILIFY